MPEECSALRSLWSLGSDQCLLLSFSLFLFLLSFNLHEGSQKSQKCPLFPGGLGEQKADGEGDNVRGPPLPVDLLPLVPPLYRLRVGNISGSLTVPVALASLIFTFSPVTFAPVFLPQTWLSKQSIPPTAYSLGTRLICFLWEF